MRLATLMCAAALLWSLASCQERVSPPVPAQHEATRQDGGDKPAASPEKPSSTAEGAFCQEHGVLEAVCTKCNPKLIPVFQAKGDWCAEHGFPESFCPICHPERAGKPAVDVKSDGAPADGTKVRFKSRDIARRAGLETAKAVERSDAGGLSAVARLTYDATRVAQVNARSPGVVLSIKVDVGARVRKGTPLAIIQSAAVGADRSRLQAARSRLEVAETSLKREQELQKQGISSLKEVQSALQEWEAAKAEHAALSASIGLVGSAAGEAGSYTLQAPLSGIVTKRDASVGAMVDTNHALFTIVDTSSVWAEVDVPESEMGGVSPGQSVTFIFDGLGEREFTGKIDYVAPELDPHTRTVLARVHLPNPDGVLRANMFGQARISAGDTRAAVAVPRSAVQRAKGVNLVFVRLKEDEYEARRVEVGASEGELMVVTKGLRPEEEVVTTGSFLLKTETLKESIGAGCCDVE